MNADTAELVYGDLTERVIGAFFDTYNELGHGFLESVYQNALAIILADLGLTVERQAPIPVHFRGHAVGDFRADLLVERLLIVEVKAVSTLVPAHDAQLLNYLKATGAPVGLLLNFGPRPQFKRRVFTERSIRANLRKSVAESIDV